MGHLVNPDRQYHLLQQRLDRSLTGAPDSPVLIEILQMLYSPAEAELARHVPDLPTKLDALARRLGVTEATLEPRLADLAGRGLMLDLEHDGERYFALPPVVIGFFELVFMRARDGLPMGELARLFEEYMCADDTFASTVFAGRTQLGRALVREEALAAADHAEVLDWERATRILESASAISVSLCPCRHKKSHLGEACEAPQRACLSFDYAAESLIHTGAGERIGLPEARRILQGCKEAGLVQIGDNVQRRVTFMCNCCRCCCGMLDAIRRFDLRTAVVTSNWLAAVDEAACKGCGKCVAACPIQALTLLEEKADGKRRKRARVDGELCLGCGVCVPTCKPGALRMAARDRRPLCPETVFDKTVAMAIERGKLAELLFDSPERLSHRALGRLVKVLERSAPFKAAMAIEPLRSAFLAGIVRGAKHRLGKLGRLISG